MLVMVMEPIQYIQLELTLENTPIIIIMLLLQQFTELLHQFMELLHQFMLELVDINKQLFHFVVNRSKKTLKRHIKQEEILRLRELR